MRVVRGGQEREGAVEGGVGVEAEGEKVGEGGGWEGAKGGDEIGACESLGMQNGGGVVSWVVMDRWRTARARHSPDSPGRLHHPLGISPSLDPSTSITFSHLPSTPSFPSNPLPNTSLSQPQSPPPSPRKSALSTVRLSSVVHRRARVAVA